MRPAASNRRQQGAASLLIALVLLMSTTLITLSVARTRVTELLMAGNENQHSRLRLMAQSEWEKAISELTGQPPGLTWALSQEDNTLISRITPGTVLEGTKTSVTFRKVNDTSRAVAVQAITGHRDETGLHGRVSQMVLLLTVLSPLAEGAPPLVINGCLHAGTAHIDIRPINSDRDDAGTAVWHFDDAYCPSFDAIDTHGGQRTETPLHTDLWSTLFSINPDDYQRLVVAESALPAARRRYWLAEPGDLSGGKWTHSLGSAEYPVILVFPPATGCPRFATGVRITGFVYIDTACTEPLAEAGLEIIGTLAINGDVETGSSRLQLNHIQIADNLQTRLSFPVLRAVKIPGSWKDF